RTLLGRPRGAGGSEHRGEDVLGRAGKRRHPEIGPQVLGTRLHGGSGCAGHSGGIGRPGGRWRETRESASRLSIGFADRADSDRANIHQFPAFFGGLVVSSWIGGFARLERRCSVWMFSLRTEW